MAAATSATRKTVAEGLAEIMAKRHPEFVWLPVERPKRRAPVGGDNRKAS